MSVPAKRRQRTRSGGVRRSGVGQREIEEIRRQLQSLEDLMRELVWTQKMTLTEVRLVRKRRRGISRKS
jgi:hypothetical protein